MTDYKKLEQRLCEIVEKRLEEGWHVKPVGFANRIQDGKCCLVGAVGIEMGEGPGGVDSAHVARWLSVDWLDLCFIETAFEGWESAAPNHILSIGRRIRSRYVDDNGRAE